MNKLRTMLLDDLQRDVPYHVPGPAPTPPWSITQPDADRTPAPDQNDPEPQ